MPPIAAVSPSLPQSDVPQPRLVRAAHEFEAQMMKELLRPLTNVEGPDGDDSDLGSGVALADFAAEALGQSLSTRGGLGIATSIVCSLSHNESNSQTVPSRSDASATSRTLAVASLK
jgi:Rod binding domain-containing protein